VNTQKLNLAFFRNRPFLLPLFSASSSPRRNRLIFDVKENFTHREGESPLFTVKAPRALSNFLEPLGALRYIMRLKIDAKKIGPFFPALSRTPTPLFLPSPLNLRALLFWSFFENRCLNAFFAFCPLLPPLSIGLGKTSSPFSQVTNRSPFSHLPTPLFFFSFSRWRNQCFLSRAAHSQVL